MQKFHPKEAVNNPNILGELFNEMYEQSSKRNAPMTAEQAHYSLHVMMGNDEGVNNMYDQLKSTFPIGGFFHRCDIFPVKYSKRLKLWLALMTMEFGIGGMILVGYYVQWYIQTRKDNDIILKNDSEREEGMTLNTIIEKLFPFGVPTEDLVHEFWDKQKVAASPDNLIDHQSAALSFMPITEEVNQ